MSNLSTNNPIEIIIVGLPRQRSESLCSALEQVEPGCFTFLHLEVSLADINPEQIGRGVILAGAEGLRGSQSLLTIAQKLRTEQFHWGPVHLFTRSPWSTPDTDQEWAIYLHRLPPDDVRNLAKILCNAASLNQSRREGIVCAAISQLAGELGSLLRSLDPSVVVEEESIRISISNLQSELKIAPSDEVFSDLCRELERLEGLPSLSEQDLNIVTPLVIKTEERARGSNSSERVRVAIHKLSNNLRLAQWRPEAAPAVARRIQSPMMRLHKRGLVTLPKERQAAVADLFNSLNPLVNSVVDGKVEDSLPSLLTQHLTNLHALIARLVPQEPKADYGVEVERIVVIEDDVNWRREIVRVLQSMGLSVSIQEAGTVTQAQSFLKDHRAALVLVDLGLPYDNESPVILDAGLSLIKKFFAADAHGKRYKHSFVVLTAAENHADAVRAALGFGISPAHYIQKSPLTWESDLRSQVRLALQRSADPPPVVEIFKRTGRIARVEGLEIKLDSPQWCLLAAFTDSRKSVWCDRERLARVLYYQYSLDPDSRGDEPDARDPEERILDQLPHYSSDLRTRLTEAYRQARHRNPAVDIVEFDEETGSYRLNAVARVLDRVDEHSLVGRRPLVLAVEDNENWGAKIKQELQQRGFDLRWVRCTEEALKIVQENPPDLISLDLELPATEAELLSGVADAGHAVEFLRVLRRDFPTLPVAILTAVPWQDSTMLEILRQGVRVDDYLSKHWVDPVGRLAASLARLWQESLTNSRILDWDPTLHLHPIEIRPEVEGDINTRILKSVASYHITAKGQGKDILKVLSSAPNVFVSRTELIEALYGNRRDPDGGPDDPDEALNSHIKRLRKTITEATGGEIPGDQVICSHRGIYWLRGLVQ